MFRKFLKTSKKGLPGLEKIVVLKLDRDAIENISGGKNSSSYNNDYTRTLPTTTTFLPNQ
jgi:hypothetical protein